MCTLVCGSEYTVLFTQKDTLT